MLVHMHVQILHIEEQKSIKCKQTIPLNIIVKLQNLNIMLFGKKLKCYIFKTNLYLRNTAEIRYPYQNYENLNRSECIPISERDLNL